MIQSRFCTFSCRVQIFFKFFLTLLLHATATFFCVLFFTLRPKKILIHLGKLPVQADFDGCENSCVHQEKHFANCRTISAKLTQHLGEQNARVQFSCVSSTEARRLPNLNLQIINNSLISLMTICMFQCYFLFLNCWPSLINTGTAESTLLTFD